MCTFWCSFVFSAYCKCTLFQQQKKKAANIFVQFWMWCEWIYNQPQRKSPKTHNTKQNIRKICTFPLFIQFFLGSINFHFSFNRFAIHCSQKVEKHFWSRILRVAYGVLSACFVVLGSFCAVCMNEKLTFSARTVNSTLSLCVCVCLPHSIRMHLQK